MPGCAYMARVLTPHFALCQVCSQPKASKPRLVAVLPSYWRATHRQVKTDECAHGSALGDRLNAAVTARCDDLLSFVALGSGVSDRLPKFPQIINQRGTTKSNVEAPCASA